MPETWRVTVDRSICIGSGMCVSSAPDDFDLGSDRQSRPRAKDMTASRAIMEAAESCPVEAIGIVSVAAGAQVFPPE